MFNQIIIIIQLEMESPLKVLNCYSLSPHNPCSFHNLPSYKSELLQWRYLRESIQFIWRGLFRAKKLICIYWLGRQWRVLFRVPGWNSDDPNCLDYSGRRSRIHVPSHWTHAVVSLQTTQEKASIPGRKYETKHLINIIFRAFKTFLLYLPVQLGKTQETRRWKTQAHCVMELLSPF